MYTPNQGEQIIARLDSLVRLLTKTQQDEDNAIYGEAMLYKHKIEKRHKRWWITLRWLMPIGNPIQEKIAKDKFFLQDIKDKPEHIPLVVTTEMKILLWESYERAYRNLLSLAYTIGAAFFISHINSAGVSI